MEFIGSCDRMQVQVQEMEAAGGVLCIKSLGIPLVPCAVAGNGGVLAARGTFHSDVGNLQGGNS